MTAEVCIMNKLAVALAADSALTLGEGKVYGSAEKIFQLSSTAPVGVMIYGGAEFLGVPWETIVKEFRSGQSKKREPTLDKYAEAFLRFLLDKKLFPKGAQDASVEVLVAAFFRYLLGVIESHIDAKVDTREVLQPEAFAQFACTLLESVKQELLRNERVEGFTPSVVASITRKFKTAISSLSHSAFRKLPLSESIHEQINSLAIEAISRRSFFPNSSGVVVAGFGDKEYMPRMRSFEVDAVVSGRLRVIRGAAKDISQESSAIVVLFAQQEMVHTFMEGIDPEYFQFVQTTTKVAMRGIVNEFCGYISNDDAKQTEDLKLGLHRAGAELAVGLFDQWQKKKEAHWRPVVEIVDALPKDEMAAMAEALVSLTKFRRRVTTDRETVGGPVDVAVITRGDGFVWVNRKHYFQPELNPRVMARYRRETDNE